MHTGHTGASATSPLQLTDDRTVADPSATREPGPITLGLLGPLLLMRGEKIVTPSAPKLRQVLSLLAVQANSVTRVDQLVEELWEESPPQSALTTVQTYIYQLRKLLRLDDKPHTGAPAPVLLSHPGGYILQLPDLESIDANLFEQLARRGRQELLSVRVEAASETFRNAMSLWRGGFLEGVATGPLLYSHATRLEELRRTVLALRIETDLQLGRHQEIIGELTSLVNAEPTREDFSAKLMIALYRSGRRADALGVYQRIRTALVDELGLDPAAELQRLHQLMLEADPELDLPGMPAAQPTEQQLTVHSGPSAPAQLPAELPDFVGRQAETDTFTRLLTGPDVRGMRVVNVVGRPGIGKSAFVARVGRAVRAHFPDGQLYVDLAGSDGEPMPTRQVLISMLKAIGAHEADVPNSVAEAALMFRSWTADRRLLVVLDNASGTNTLRHLVPSGSGCALVVLSRVPVDALAGAVRLRLPVLSMAESVRLLANTVGEQRVSQELDAAERLAELTDRLPLALRAVGAKLAGRPGWYLSRMVARMTDERNRLTELSYGGFDVFGRLAEAYQRLSARQRWVFRRLAAVEGELLTASEIAERVSMAPAAVHTVLDELVDADLVEELAGEPDGADQEPRHHVPALVRLVGLSGTLGSSWWKRTRGEVSPT
ncbi:AfsR/SARP family transcriptional regulator [Actinophytocola gossypii]|uniref:Winged helix-turn-helix domain-containing protein n=1 Tax=Actinophytocola gossypii TaxID=2812003 RepID=A0ABT2JD35_9PSEU|nr:BTAD domain-containing putative transcriptional regulator [Actinophytocola gossypii]MCT2585786.1 winged helix-turn-helix domain-containing protein [Actinophytocola gossypii]